MTVVSPATDPAATTVQVWVQADNPGELLKPGTTVRVAIVAATDSERHGGAADGHRAGRRRRERGDDGSDNTAHLKPVELGARENGMVQIVRGVSPGEQVITVGAIGLENDAKVRIVQPGGKMRPRPAPTGTERRNEHRATARAARGEPTRAGRRGPLDRTPRQGDHLFDSHADHAGHLHVAIPVAVFPETNFPRVVVGVDNGVMPIDQMMVTITRPLEEALNTVQGLDYMWSVTSRGSAEIDLFFNWNVDMFRTLTLVNAALAQVQPTLPSTARVTATRLTFAAFPIIGYSLTSDRVPMTRIWEMAYYELKPRINRTTGTANVVVQGGQVPEFDIVPDAAKLVQTGVTIPEVLDAIAHTNMVDSPGLIEWRHQLVLSLVSGQTRNPPEIADIVVKTTPAGLPVHIGDIASVEPGVMPVYTIVTANGRPAVLINVFRQIGGNTVATADAVHAEVARIRKTLPPGVEMKLFYDQSEIVKASIESVRDAILVGLLLASLIMVLFLRDWGTSLVAGMVIPATIAVTVVVLRVLHHSYNLMTLGGMAAAVGLVIDDAIVVVENIVMHRDAGQSRSQAIGSALAEVRKPLIGSTVTPIVVFLPLIAISGVTGVFFRALAVTVGSALLTSLALALTWTPTLSHYLIRERRRNAASLRHANVPDWIMRRYERTLRFTLEHPFLLAAFAAVLVAVSYLCYTHTGSDLLPYMDEGGFIIDYVSPAGTSLDDTNRMLMHVEQILQNTPEVASFSRRTGLQLGLAAVTEANTGDLSVLLKKHHKKPTEEVIKEVREKVLKAEPLLDVEFPQLLSDMIGDLTSEPEPCVIKLFSENEAILREWAPRVADEIKKIPGVVDVFNGIENTISGPAITFNVDPTVAARAGFTAQEVEQDVSAILQGEPATTPVVANDRTLHRSRALPARRALPHRNHPQHPAGERQRKDGDAGNAGQPGRDSGPARNSSREPAARRAGDGAVRKHEPGYGDGAGETRGGPPAPADRHPGGVRRPV